MDERKRVKDANLTQYRTAFDSRGFKFDRWIDSFNFGIFPLTTSDPYFRISIKFGTLDSESVGHNGIMLGYNDWVRIAMKKGTYIKRG